MTLIKPLALATAILPVIFAADYPSPLARRVATRSLSPAVAQSLTSNANPDFEAGRCKFHAHVFQHCNGASLTTSLTIPSINDNAGKDIVKPALGQPVTVDQGPWNITGLGQQFTAFVEEGELTYVYGQTLWTSEQSFQAQGDFACSVNALSSEDLTCGIGNEGESRTQDMDCIFSCSPHTTGQSSTTQPSKRTEALDESLAQIKREFLASASSLPTPVSPKPAATPTASVVPYAHGVCWFRMQLCDQCKYHDIEQWHTEMYGDLYGIQDAKNNTVVTYPNGAGRIDQGGKTLTGMGGLGVMWSDSQQLAAFVFNDKQWTTNTKDDGKEEGLCNMTPWDNQNFTCSAATGYQERASIVTCVFHC